MGGPGSGRDFYPMKTAVKECFFLDVNHLAREGALDDGAQNALIGDDPHGGPPFLVTFSTEFDDRRRRFIILSYHWVSRFGRDMEDISLTIPLDWTPPYFGGLRWWFTCPLAGKRCIHRVAKLYLPPGARYFGCRDCHHLVYRHWDPWDELEKARRRLEALSK